MYLRFPLIELNLTATNNNDNNTTMIIVQLIWDKVYNKEYKNLIKMSNKTFKKGKQIKKFEW